MRYAETLLSEFDNEMKTTRTMLEQVPFGTDATKPGEKSRTMHELAAHIANIVRFGDLAIGSNERDLAVPGAVAPATYGSSEELLKTFDTNAAASRAAIQGLDESTLGETFTLRRGENVLIALPRSAALRVLLMNHTIHHRGQLSAYFRLNGVTHPPIYGPNAEMSGR
jgi:uncharacterized damage-inducible protein DinB